MPSPPRPDRAEPVRLSVVVPAYNEAGNLGPLLRALTERLAACTPLWEVIVVDDGSRDATAAAIAPWLSRPGIRLLSLSRNFGKEAALTAGIDRATGDAVVLMDGDGQHPPELIAPMLAAWRDGADMVCAARASRDDDTLLRRLGTRIFYRLVNVGSPVAIASASGDFRLMDRRVVEALKSLPERNRFMKGLYAWVGFETRTVPYSPEPRGTGRSSFSLRGLARLGITGVTAFSNTPLRLWSAIGAVMALFAFAFGMFFVVEHFLTDNPVPGWATLVASIAFFSGIQLLSIGILGEYIGRIFDEVKQRPVYVIAHEAGRATFDEMAPPVSGPPAEIAARAPRAAV